MARDLFHLTKSENGRAVVTRWSVPPGRQAIREPMVLAIHPGQAAQFRKHARRVLFKRLLEGC
jgi:hypothetical protein